MAKDIVEYKARDGQVINLNIDIVRKYLVRGNNQGATSQEIIFFMGICKSRGLNPFKNDCYLIKYGDDPAAIITSIDYFRARAKAQPDCMGWNNGIIVKDKETETIKKTNGLFDKEKEILLGGWFEALPKGWKEPCKLEINLFGYIKKTKDGKITQFWHEDKQPTMIAKVAESQGLRKCWPDEFQGIYSDAEIIQEEIEQPEKFKINKEIYKAKTVSEISTKEFEEEIKSSDDIDDQNKILIASFSKLNKEPLQKFEQTHRTEISTWPHSVREAFYEKWEKKTKTPYEIFLRRLNIINNQNESNIMKPTAAMDTVGLKLLASPAIEIPKAGEGMIICPADEIHKTYAVCKNECPGDMFKTQSCLARFPELRE